MNSIFFEHLLKKVHAIIISQKRNIKSLSVLVFVNFAVAGVGAITQLKIANMLGRESFGIIAYSLAIAAFCAVVIRFALDRTMVRDLIHHPNRFTATVKASLILRFTLLVFVAVLILGWKIFQAPNGDVTWGIVLIIVANAAMSLDLKGVYDSWHEMSRHAFYVLLQRGLYFMVIWIVIANAPELLSVFTVGAATFVSVSIYLTLQYSWAMRRLPEDETNENLVILAFSMARGNVYLWLAALAALSFGPLNQVVLKNYHGAAELGSYAAAWLIVTLVSMFLAQIARIGQPATARITSGSATRQDKFQFLMKYTLVMALLVLPATVVVVSVPEQIMEVLFVPEYISAAPALQVMGIYMIIFAIGQVASQYMVSARMEKAYTVYAILGGGLGFIMCFLLIPSMGGLGAALALLVSHGFSIFMYWRKVLLSLKSDSSV